MKNVTHTALAALIFSTSLDVSAKIIYKRSDFGMDIICAGVKMKGVDQLDLKNNGRVFADRIEMHLPCEVIASQPAYHVSLKLFCPKGSPEPSVPLHGNQIIYIKNEGGKLYSLTHHAVTEVEC